MSLAESNHQQDDNRRSVTIGLLLGAAGELASAHPVASRRVGDALSVACFLAVSGRGAIAAAVLGAGAAALIERRNARRTPEPEPVEWEPWDPVEWFEDVCARAKVPVPLVKDHWPTEEGHAYYLLITEWVERDGRPMTVDAWMTFAPLLRDVAGMGCSWAQPIPDEHNGGLGAIEFRGVRFHGYEYEPGPECDADDCTNPPTLHFLLNEEQDCVMLCAEHSGKLPRDRYLERHPIRDVCHEDGWWHPARRGQTSRCATDPPAPVAETPSADESVRECTAPLEPLSPQRILLPAPEEGSGVEPDPVPSLPPPDPATRRPAGANPGTLGGRVFDCLVAAQGPLRRGSLAEMSGASPTTVDKLLNAWADVGATERVGSLWTIASRYQRSASLWPDGSEEDAGG